MSENRCIPHLRASLLADMGIGRDYQEDCVGYGDLYGYPDYRSLALQKGNLYVLADGVGGHQAGDVAGEMAVFYTLSFFYDLAELAIDEALVEAIHRASRQISHYAARSGFPEAAVRSTVACAVIHGNELYTVNVGDSRAYLIRDGQIIQLSEDHSRVAQWVREGKITPEQARDHSQRNVVTQALGGASEVQPSQHWEELLAGDQIVLCSDGLHGVVDDDTIARVVAREADPQSACEQLVDLANEAGGPDNISIIAIHVDDFAAEEIGAGAGGQPAAPEPKFEKLNNGVIALRPLDEAESTRPTNLLKDFVALFERR